MTMMPQARRFRYIGLDVHRATIAVAIAEDDGSPPTSYTTIANDPTTMRKLLLRLGLGQPEVRLRAAYEAGPTGYVLQRQLTSLGVECMVAAPSLIPIRPGDKVKTDRRDALKLARLLRSGDLTAIWVPDEAHEALRNLVRARADAKADEVRAKHRLSKFLLRQGRLTPPAKTKSWSRRYLFWLRQLEFAQAADQLVFADYLAVVIAASERVARLEAALHSTAHSSAQMPLIQALQSFRGIGFLSAATIVAEAGNLRRFRTAPQFMAYVGVVPSEYSSGSRQHRGRITKTGNRLLRHVLGEAAHHARHAPNLGDELKRRQRPVPPAIVEHAWRAQLRLHTRYRQLGARIGPPRALTAIARELAGFIWAAGQLMPEASAA